MTVRKELTFDAAHMLSDYDGKCNNLHGHTYKVVIELTGEVSADTGMLVDFNAIKRVVDKYDHAVVFGGDSVREPFEDELLRLVLKYGKRHLVMPSAMKPTAENMALCMQREFKLFPNVKTALVMLWETPTACAGTEEYL